MPDPYTPAELELAAQAIRDNNPPEAWAASPQLVPAGHYAAAVLDAAAPLIAARVRAEHGEQIAQAIEADAAGRALDCFCDSAHAEIARTHATTEEDTDAT